MMLIVTVMVHDLWLRDVNCKIVCVRHERNGGFLFLLFIYS